MQKLKFKDLLVESFKPYGIPVDNVDRMLSRWAANGMKAEESMLLAEVFGGTARVWMKMWEKYK